MITELLQAQLKDAENAIRLGKNVLIVGRFGKTWFLNTLLERFEDQNKIHVFDGNTTDGDIDNVTSEINVITVETISDEELKKRYSSYWVLRLKFPSDKELVKILLELYPILPYDVAEEMLEKILPMPKIEKTSQAFELIREIVEKNAFGDHDAINANILSEEERLRLTNISRNTCIHECSHMLAYILLDTGDTGISISMLQDSERGFNASTFTRRNHFIQNKAMLENKLVELLSGEISTRILCNDTPSIGIYADLIAATKLAREYVEMGVFSDDELKCFKAFGDKISHKSLEYIEEKTFKIISQAKKATEEFIRNHESEINLMADYTMKHGIVSANEYRKLLNFN